MSDKFVSPVTICMIWGCFPHDHVIWIVHTGKSPTQGQFHGVWPVTQGLMFRGPTLGFNVRGCHLRFCFVSGLMKQWSMPQWPVASSVSSPAACVRFGSCPPPPPRFPLPVPVWWLWWEGPECGTGKAGVRTACPLHHGISGRWQEDTSQWGQVFHPHPRTWHHSLDIVHFQQEALHFHFTLCLTDYVAGPAPRKIDLGKKYLN